MAVRWCVQLLIVTAMIFAFTACGKGSERSAPQTNPDESASTTAQPTGSVSDSESGVSPPSYDTAETTATPPEPVTPPRPEGEVPQPLVGVWSGGEGSKSGYRLTFFADSTYELVHERNTAIPMFREVGYCVGDSSHLLLRPFTIEGPVEHGERAARWSIQPSSVVDVLTVVDQFDGELPGDGELATLHRPPTPTSALSRNRHWWCAGCVTPRPCSSLSGHCSRSCR